MLIKKYSDPNDPDYTDCAVEDARSSTVCGIILQPEASQKPPIDPDRATDHRARRLWFSDKFSVQVGERINL